MDGDGHAAPYDDGALLTIGAFARASRLSPKALRLYDELGLLPPAHVDPHSGYRHYAPAQLERARLVAWLRRLGMPLARIREVCELAPDAAALAVAAYWAQVEADTAARRDLAAFLVDQLERKNTAMTTPHTPLTMRYAALTDQGLVRPAHQDAAHAGPRLLAVADGYGPDGGQAAKAAIEALKGLEDQDLTSTDLLGALEEAAHRAHRAHRDHRAAPAAEKTSGCTLTALLRSGTQLALLHVGDSRAYVLRDSGLFQITHDHSLVQSLIDEGRLTPEEAASHPQRAQLLRSLDGATEFAPDLQLLEARPGERYLLCTDGLTGVVPAETIQRVLTAADGPDQAVRELIRLAREAGAPDNVGCVVAEMTGA
ncbi:MerR family transcriptional regulator [Streptomyces platensis]|uniref:MerR family transcriptional regulator n=1 Tax=Streptomyces platensis TaxID=58346 RepID=UPI002E156A03|nr:MerR family transcriptional regulator [Streptomyces platensis]WSI57215.1 MerR family transcriptional regulator [Streptomyces platensis]